MIAVRFSTGLIAVWFWFSLAAVWFRPGIIAVLIQSFLYVFLNGFAVILNVFRSILLVPAVLLVFFRSSLMVLVVLPVFFRSVLILLVRAVLRNILILSVPTFLRSVFRGFLIPVIPAVLRNALRNCLIPVLPAVLRNIFNGSRIVFPVSFREFFRAFFRAFFREIFREFCFPDDCFIRPLNLVRVQIAYKPAGDLLAGRNNLMVRIIGIAVLFNGIGGKGENQLLALVGARFPVFVFLVIDILSPDSRAYKLLRVVFKLFIRFPGTFHGLHAEIFLIVLLRIGVCSRDSVLRLVDRLNLLIAETDVFRQPVARGRIGPVEAPRRNRVRQIDPQKIALPEFCIFFNSVPIGNGRAVFNRLVLRDMIIVNPGTPVQDCLEIQRIQLRHISVFILPGCIRICGSIAGIFYVCGSAAAFRIFGIIAVIFCVCGSAAVFRIFGSSVGIFYVFLTDFLSALFFVFLPGLLSAFFSVFLPGLVRDVFPIIVRGIPVFHTDFIIHCLDGFRLVHTAQRGIIFIGAVFIGLIFIRGICVIFRAVILLEVFLKIFPGVFLKVFPEVFSVFRVIFTVLIIPCKVVL